jgi:uncharacterized membrane protein YqjE
LVALVSVIVSPVVVVVEFIALMILARAIYGPEYSLVAKAVSVAVLVALGLIALALPVTAVITGTRARAAARLMATQKSGVATAAVVIGAIVTVGIAVAQVYVALLGTGVCGLDGC